MVDRYANPSVGAVEAETKYCRPGGIDDMASLSPGCFLPWERDNPGETLISSHPYSNGAGKTTKTLRRYLISVIRFTDRYLPELITYR